MATAETLDTSLFRLQIRTLFEGTWGTEHDSEVAFHGMGFILFPVGNIGAVSHVLLVETMQYAEVDEMVTNAVSSNIPLRTVNIALLGIHSSEVVLPDTTLQPAEGYFDQKSFIERYVGTPWALEASRMNADCVILESADGQQLISLRAWRDAICLRQEDMVQVMSVVHAAILKGQPTSVIHAFLQSLTGRADLDNLL